MYSSPRFGWYGVNPRTGPASTFARLRGSAEEEPRLGAPADFFELAEAPDVFFFEDVLRRVEAAVFFLLAVFFAAAVFFLLTFFLLAVFFATFLELVDFFVTFFFDTFLAGDFFAEVFFFDDFFFVEAVDFRACFLAGFLEAVFFEDFFVDADALREAVFFAFVFLRLAVFFLAAAFVAGITGLQDT